MGRKPFFIPDSRRKENTEPKTLISRTVETAAGIGFGLPVAQGTNDGGVIATVAGTTAILGITVLKVIGPGVGRFKEVLAGVNAKTDEERAVSGSAAISAIADIFAQADPVQVAALVKDVVEVAQIRRDSGNYDQCDLDGDFTHNQGDLYPVVFLVLKEQFGSFFTGLLGSGNLKPKAA